MKRLTLLTALVAILLSGIVPPAHAASYKVVVHASNPVRSLSADRLSKLFLKKITRWDDGGEAEPVDRDDDSPVRVAFSQEVHGKEVGSIESYWQKMIFSGRATPPPELSSDAEVLAFVRSHPRAVGYVSAGTPTGDGVVVIEVGR